MTKNNITVFSSLLIILLVSHFIPFERSSFAPDDYSLMNLDKLGFKNFLYYSDRPLLFLWLEIQYFLVGESLFIGLIVLILSNFLVIISVYFLLLLYFNKDETIIITIIFILLTNKVEIYHNLIMSHINIVTSMYLISLIFLIKSQKNMFSLLYIISLLLYLLAIFWYEIGFFLPFLILINKKKQFSKNFKLLVPFLFIIVIYILFRTTNFFGIINTEPSHNIDLSLLKGIIDLFHHFIGRYFVKNIVYGIYQFFGNSISIIIILLLTNFLISFIYINKLLIGKNINISKKYIFFVFLFIFTVIPMILNGQAGGRNLIIPSISFSLLIYYISIKILNKKFFLSFIFSLFIISQGHSLSHYVASNIQSSMFETINKNSNNIKDVEYILIDTQSFKNNIKHSFLNNEYNFLNNYYGAQVWEIWGLSTYVNKINKNIKIFILSDGYEFKNNKITFNYISDQKGKKIYKKNLILDPQNVFFLDFNLVYPNGFNYGK